MENPEMKDQPLTWPMQESSIVQAYRLCTLNVEVR